MRGPVEAKEDTVFFDDFSDKDYCLANYTYLDPDNDAILEDNGFYKNRWFWKEDEKLMQFCSDNVHVGNDWLMTPAISLDGLNTYKLSFEVNMGAPSNLKVTLGTSPDPKDHQIVLIDKQNIHDKWKTSYTTDFIIPSAGNYYIGFYNYNGLDGFYFNLFKVLVEKGLSGSLPSTVNNLVVKAGENGEEKVYFSFDTPSKKINGDLLDNDLKVNIYRDDEKIHIMNVQPAQTYTWEDENVKSGNHTYCIVCENVEGEGFPVSQTLFVGSDLSEPVGNLIVKTVNDGMAVALSWDAPTKGVNGGYFNIEDVTYAVLRSDDGKNYIPLQEGITDLEYVDNTIVEALEGKPYQQESFYYAVVAVNPAGNSEAHPQLLVIGKPYEAPVGESFPNSKFNIYPWTTNPIKGHFGWECLKNDSKAKVYPQDNDNGFIKFNNPWGDKEVDSRLLTPIISLENMQNPLLTFFMYHLSKQDSETVNATLVIEISEDNGASFTPICDPIDAFSDKEGWAEHKISLKEYVGKSNIRLAFRGYTDCSWMYYFVDNINIEEKMDYDLSVWAIEGPNKLAMDEEFSINFSYYNRGFAPVSDYMIHLFENNRKIYSVEGENIEPGQIDTVKMTYHTSAFHGDKELIYHVEIDFPKDQKVTNNRSTDIKTFVSGIWYPVIEDLYGVSDDEGIKLSWNFPEIPTEIQETFDGAEDYEPFALDNYGDWISYDGDQLGSGGWLNLPADPHRGQNKAFQIWSPHYLDPDTTDWERNFPDLLPYEGDQCFTAWFANRYVDDKKPYNDDWLISPEILPGSNVKFYIKRLRSYSFKDVYQVLYSSTTRTPDTLNVFKVLKTGIAQEQWEEINLKLPEDARYFAVRFKGSETDKGGEDSGIMVDNFTYTSAIYRLKIEGYNIYRDGQQLNEDLLSSAWYEDKDVVQGQTYEYCISTVYNLGESIASEPILVTYDKPDSVQDAENQQVVIYSKEGNLVVECPIVEDITVYSVSGIKLFSGVINEGVLQIPLEQGTYIVEVGGIQRKVIM